MGRTRNEELHKIQDLGLIRDERDRELERTSRSRACSVLVTVSLLMAAACLLQGDSAWAALLALTPLSWAVQNFSRFAADGKRLYLVLALLSGAAALGLAGWYLIQGQESGLFSIGRLIGFAVLSCLLISLAGLVFLALFLSAMFLKGRIGRMNGERWERWFRSVSTLGLLVRLGVLMAFAVLLVSIVSIPLFQFLGFPAPERLALVLLAAGLAYLLGKMNRELEASAAGAGDVLPRRSLFLSKGTVDQVYLAVRLAVYDLCLREHQVPLVLDDALAAFDQARMERALDLLVELSQEEQILFFTCQSREGTYLSKTAGVRPIPLP